jgi:hypothetical protein
MLADVMTMREHSDKRSVRSNSFGLDVGLDRVGHCGQQADSGRNR